MRSRNLKAEPLALFAGLPSDRTAIMGIVNVTPDSFSDGGDHETHDAAIAHGLRLAADGAEILDVGGESTRPGAEPVPVDEEARRVVPVVRALAEAGHIVSIDTRRPTVMEQAVVAGAAIINDVTALTDDARSVETAGRLDVPVILMHMQGAPQTMQTKPTYDFAPADIATYLQTRVEACQAAGIERANICIDPGIGFGKTVEHNLQLLAHLDRFEDLGCWTLVGASRKTFIGKLTSAEDPKDRLAGSLAVAHICFEAGVNILRVHDVKETVQARTIWEAAKAARKAP